MKPVQHTLVQHYSQFFLGTHIGFASVYILATLGMGACLSFALDAQVSGKLCDEILTMRWKDLALGSNRFLIICSLNAFELKDLRCPKILM
jgi:hypothetical protein